VFRQKYTAVLDEHVSSILILFVNVQLAWCSDTLAHCRRIADRGNRTYKTTDTRREQTTVLNTPGNNNVSK